MLDPNHPLAALLQQDKRYKLEAYVFIFEALGYAQNVLGMGEEKPSESAINPMSYPDPDEDLTQVSERHVTGQELCEAIRQYALQQYGYMSKTVLNSWGLCATDDFGEIVFNLIRIGQMRKTPADTIVDFHDVYDFDKAFRQDFRISRH